MNLQNVRRNLIQQSGRADLVLDEINYENNGADFFITAGQRWLDRTFEIYKSHGRRDILLPIGQWWALIPDCRAIDQVWASNDACKWQVERANEDELKGVFKSVPTSIVGGAISVFAPVSFRGTPDSTNATLIDVWGTVNFTDDTQSNFDLNGLVFMPPTDVVVNLEVHGLFYQPQLIDNIDTNMWSEQDPFILVLAAMRAIEVTMRNSAGVRDYEEAIRSEMSGLEKDFAAQLSNEIVQMRG